jgi:hypothetical protein
MSRKIAQTMDRQQGHDPEANPDRDPLATFVAAA